MRKEKEFLVSFSRIRFEDWPLEELEKLHLEGEELLAYKTTGYEFWLSLWKASPYAALSAFSISGIVALLKESETPGLILIPILILLIILMIMAASCVLSIKIGKSIPGLRTNMDKVRQEVEFRRGAIQNWFEHFKHSELDVKWREFELQSFPNINLLPSLRLSNFKEEILGSLRLRDLKYTSPPLWTLLEDSMNAEKNYNDALNEFYAALSKRVLDILKGVKFDFDFTKPGDLIELTRVLLNVLNMHVRSAQDGTALQKGGIGENGRLFVRRIFGEGTKDNPWPRFLRDDELKSLAIKVQEEMIKTRNKRYDTVQRILSSYNITKDQGV